MSFLQRLRILPLLVIVASLCLFIRVGEFVSGVEQSGIAHAQVEVDDQPPPLPAKETEYPEEEEPAEDIEELSKEETHIKESIDEDKGIPPIPMATEGEEINWKDSSEAEFEYSEVRTELYKDLVKRREQIENQERVLATREALLEAAERELDQKIREMTAVRDEIKSLLAEQSEQEQERINSLVRIYEGMKAKDAARIFNTLDLDVLIAVISRMSERKSGPILAEMNAERARSVTILMAQQKQIPSIPPQ